FQGWGDVSFHGSTQVPTPNIDVLAGDGVILNNYYSLPLCTPSRSALMTGFYPIHTGMQAYVIQDAAPWGLPLELKIMPQHFKDLGYQVNMIGKLFSHAFYCASVHMLDAIQMKEIPPFEIPPRMRKHFNVFITCKNYFRNRTMLQRQEREVKQIVIFLCLCVLLNLYSQPFFCYFSYQAVHAALMNVPFQAPERNVLKFPYIGETNRTLYAGEMKINISWGVADASLLKIKNDTIIAFSSDNGGLPYGAYSNRGFNWLLRGAKFTLWEGGVRVPAFVWSSKFLKKPRVSDQLMHISDWLPTLYSAAGKCGDVSNLGSMDGIDMWRYLTLGFGSGRKEVLLTIDPMENLAGLRYKNYKLVVGEGFDEELDGRYSFPGGLRPTNDVPQLRKDSRVARVLKAFYGKQNRNWSPLDWSKNPVVDCRERWLTNNFVARQPPYLFILRFMMRKLAACNATAVPPRFQAEDPRGYPEYHGGVWSPWLD
ncbi:unnamed protein product, partial [Ixodes persulcatus]